MSTELVENISYRNQVRMRERYISRSLFLLGCFFSHFLFCRRNSEAVLASCLLEVAIMMVGNYKASSNVLLISYDRVSYQFVSLRKQPYYSIPSKIGKIINHGCHCQNYHKTKSGTDDSTHFL